MTRPPPHPIPSRARRPTSARGPGARHRGAWSLLGLVVVVLLGGACSGAPEFDREAAVTRVVDSGAGVIDRSEAECYVDQVSNELGTGVLAEAAEPQPEQIRRLTGIKIDCFGVDGLGASTSVSRPPVSAVDGAIPQPMAYGDDAELDALWDRCGAGSGVACDQLFDQAPINSAYEEFAGTCGNRTQELSCAPVYSIPGEPARATVSADVDHRALILGSAAGHRAVVAARGGPGSAPADRWRDPVPDHAPRVTLRTPAHLGGSRATSGSVHAASPRSSRARSPSSCCCRRANRRRRSCSG